VSELQRGVLLPRGTYDRAVTYGHTGHHLRAASVFDSLVVGVVTQTRSGWLPDGVFKTENARNSLVAEVKETSKTWR